MDAWDIALWSVAAYIGVLTLVRFMTVRRNKILDDLRRRAAAAQASRPTPAETNAEAIKS